MPTRLATYMGELTAWRRALLAVGLGALAVLALPPIYIVPILIISFAGLVCLVDAAPGRRGAFLTGWWFGLGYSLAGLYWVGKSFSVAGVAEWAAPFAVLLLAATCALFPGLAALTLRLAPGRGMARIAWFASAWIATEWLRTFVPLGGFPWNLVGYVWMPSDAMIQTASVFGIYGLSWATVLAASAPVFLTEKSGAWRGIAASWLLLALMAGGGVVRLANANVSDVPDIRLRLVQANIAQFHKWRDDLRAQNLRTYLDMSAAPSAVGSGPSPTHIIWPETAVPYLIANEPLIREQIAQVVPSGGTVITGAVRADTDADGTPRVWNSLQAVDPGGTITATYDKFHLVPFGEYTPFRRILKIAKLTEGDTDFSPGPGPQSLAVGDLPPVSPLICYEAIFPGNVIRPDARPDWLLNVTNDGWYGISSGPHQHFQQARLRAVEEGLPLVRVANTGISGVIDPYGRVRQSLGLGEAGVIDANLPAALSAPTLYGFWRDWPILVVFVLSLVILRHRTRVSNRA